MAMKVVTKKGSWFSFGTQQLAQGRIQVLDLMRKSDDLTQEILSKIEAAKAAGVVPEEEPDVEKVVNKGEDPDAIDGAAEEGAEVQDV
jgi:hypothetical protein